MTNAWIEAHPIPRPRRRDVLAWGAGLALLPSAAWAARQEPAELAVAYCPRSPADAGGLASPVAACRLAGGDPRLARRGARVTVHGLVGDAGRLRRRGILGLDLQVGFAVAGAEPSDSKYRAWSWQLLPVEQESPPVRFDLPATGGLRLALDVETPLGTERREARLVTGRRPGTAKLRTGRYLIAPRAAEPGGSRFDPEQGEALVSLMVEEPPTRSS